MTGGEYKGNSGVFLRVGDLKDHVNSGMEVQILDLDLSQSAMKDRPAEGYISFQDEGKPGWYRNVRIKELK